MEGRILKQPAAAAHDRPLVPTDIPTSSYSSICVRSQARAVRQSRLTVAVETPSA